MTAISLMLAVPDAPAAAEWYKKAVGATELWNRGSVIGLEVGGAPIFLGQPEANGWSTPEDAGTRTARVEIFVDDPDAFIARAVEAGADASTEKVQDHEAPWGTHRQGSFLDPWGHKWLVGDRSPLRRFVPRGEMRAVVLENAPGELKIQHLKVPNPQPGWVLIQVRAFGLNRSELHTRIGLAEGVTFPRVLGIEATGYVVDAPRGEFATGQQVMTMMGGMGRTFDGGYAQYTCVPAEQVVPFKSDLEWSTLGAIPEMLQTAYGSLYTGLEIKPDQTLLIRGGTSSVGLAAIILAKREGLRVLATTRDGAKAAELHRIGADHVIVDDGDVAEKVRAIVPSGVHSALELVGAPTVKDSLKAVRKGGTLCFTGMLSNEWILPDFYPMDWIPNGVKLTAYSGESGDLPRAQLQVFLDAVAKGEVTVPIGHVFTLDQIVEAHEAMEAGTYTGKLVVLTN